MRTFSLIPEAMGAKAKIGISVILIVILGLAIWQLTSPRSIPSVGTKYFQPGPLSEKGSWIVAERTGSGMVFLAISIANLTYPRAALSTTYSVLISKINETITSTYARTITVRVTSLTLQDNYDGKFTGLDTTGLVPDAVQVTTLFHFTTSADHQLQFTITYQVYNLLVFGYTIDHAQTRSYNITQTII
jgi:hypothetical protein